MGRIEEIKDRLNKYRTAPRDGFQKGIPIDTVKTIGYFADNAPADIEYLLSRLQIAEEALYKYSAMIVLDSEDHPHDVGMVAREALEQMQKLAPN